MLNKDENSWQISQLCLLGSPTKNGKALDSICHDVAISAAHRQGNESKMLQDQSTCGLRWRRNYMMGINTRKMQYIASLDLKSAKGITVVEKLDE